MKKKFSRSDEQPSKKSPAMETKGGKDSARKPRPEKSYKPVTVNKAEEEVRLNKYISNAGVCSRRDADKLISKGEIKVNGEVVTEMGYKVKPGDKVSYQNQRLLMVSNPVYILLNKPKDTITTTDDPEKRKTVMDLVADATDERVYPVGRLDRNTTGVLLLTNDGELAQRLTHPQRKVKKVYAAELDKSITDAHLTQLVTGIDLEDGMMFADTAALPDPLQKHIVGIEIHSGKNRVVRRMFEKMGYVVKKLDRVLFANLDKRKLKKGEWRMLTEKELRVLKNSVGLK
jgi:23S rRNA pseudouridine2605 synthase